MYAFSFFFSQTLLLWFTMVIARYIGEFTGNVVMAILSTSGVLLLVIVGLSVLYSPRQTLSERQVLSEQTKDEKVDSSSVILSVSSNPIPSPHQQQIRIGIVHDDYANRQGSITGLESALGISFSTISIFKQFGHPYNRELIQEDLVFTKESGKKLLIAWEPWNPDEGMGQSVDYISEIPLGKHDAYIVQFANQVKAYGLPVIIRFGHEMNGNWYPWGNRSEEYKAAYRYIVDKFRVLNITNASWMWSINANNVPASPITTASVFYPGDEYVDIIGLDGFNFGSGQGHSWMSFSQIFQPSYSFVTIYKKPIIISETASAEIGGNKAEWVEKAILKELPASFPLISEIVWFSLLKEADWRIDSSNSSLEAFTFSLK